MGTILDWSTRFATGGGIDRVSTEMQNLTDLTHNTRVSHVESLRDAVIELENQSLGAKWFEWNGTDVTQFDSKVDGSEVTSSSISVVSRAGVNWLNTSVTANAGNGLTTQTVWPIITTPPTADYLVIGDFITEAQSTGGSGQSFVGVNVWCRFVSLESGYFIRIADRLDISAEYQIFKAVAGPALSSQSPDLGLPNLATTDDGMTVGMRCTAQTMVQSFPEDEFIHVDTATPVTAVGQAAIGQGTTGAAGTASNYWRNIKCYSIG